MTNRNPQNWLSAIFLCTTIAGAGLLYYAIKTDYEETLANARAETATVARVLDENAERGVEDVDRVLRRVVGQSQSDGLASISAPEEVERLREDRDRLPQLAGITFYDQTGKAVFDLNGLAPAEQPSIARLPQFLRHRDGGAALGAGPAMTGVGSGFTLSRRIERPGGGFGGVAVATLDAQYFLGFYESLSGLDKFVANLLSADGALLVRYPPLPATIARQTGKFEIPPGPTGTLDAISPLDGVHRIGAYRKLEGFPLMVSVGIAEADLLADWRIRRDRTILFGMGALATLLLQIGWGMRSLERLQAAHRLSAVEAAQAWTVLDRLESAIALLDSRGTILRANRTWNDLAPSEVGVAVGSAGEDYPERIRKSSAAPEMRDWLAASLHEMLAGSRESASRDYCLESGAVPRWYNIGLMPSPNGVLVVRHDEITRFKQSELVFRRREEELRRNQALYRAIASNIPKGIVAIFDRDLRYRFFDGGGLLDTGRRRIDMEGRTIWQLYDSPTCLLLEGLYTRVLAGEDVESDLHLLGHVYALRALPLRSSAGEIYAGLVLTQDVTETRELARQLALENQALAESREAARMSEAHFRGAFETTGYGMAIVGLDGGFIEVNQACSRMLGYAREELYGLDFQAITWPDDLDADISHVRRLIAGEADTYEMEKRYLHKDGHLVWAQLNVSLVRDADRKPVHFVSQIQDISKRKEAEARVRHLGQYDGLTELPNRTLMLDRLGRLVVQATRHHWRMAVLFLDLDGFKAVNDGHGHDVGDQLLHHVARRLEGSVRKEDTVARLGGDEFVILLAQISSHNDGELVARKITTAFESPFTCAGQSLKVGISIGIAVFPDHGNDPASLLRKADAAMYRAKASSPDHFALAE